MISICFFSMDLMSIIDSCYLCEQRPPYFSFKMGVPSAARRALKLSIVASVFSAILLELLPHPFKYSIAIRRFFTEQIVFFIGIFAIFFCWELTHRLHRVGFRNTLI